MNYTSGRDMSMDQRVGELQAAEKQDRDIRKPGELLALVRSVRVNGNAEQVRDVGELVCRAERKFGTVTPKKGTKK